MECPSCHADVSSGKRYCIRCGKALPLLCSACGGANAPDARFCGDCGTPLTSGTSGPERFGLAADADAVARPTPSAERRQLTVLIVDLVDSTALSARLDPEDMREIIGAYHSCCAAEIAQAGGFVAKYMGDGVLAYFGYPQAHEDDAEQAVRAGLALIEAVNASASPPRLQVRIGIATGLVVVGDLIGSGSAQEQAVVGETPNLAARLQVLAEPNTIVINERARRQVGGLFEFCDLGVKTLKGFATSQRAWQVLGESDVASRFEALRSRATALVGREEELELLMRRWTSAKAGEGRVVLLCAEPGVGKSRLTEAVRELILAESHRSLRYFCSPHHSESALHPIIRQLERAAGFERGDDVTVKRRKLAEFLAEGTAEEELPLFAELLSVPDVKSQAFLELTPQRKKEKTFDALLRMLERLARQQPLLMVFEDLHWMDPTSLELLDRTIARVDQLPVLLIATFRPEFQPPWTGQAYVSTLALSRLGRGESATLVRRLAGNTTLPDEFVEEIVERTDGVPLFVEEVTKVVLEATDGVETTSARGTIDAISGTRPVVPATLQASLLARLDRLGPAAREVAQAGGAIGREFSYDLLVSAAPRAEAETRNALDRLVGAGLVFQHGVPPAATYQFKHALVQDTAYGTLLRGPRQTLHGRIADALIARSAERSAAAPEIIARHLENAGRSAQAITYWREAGEQALRVSANHEAAAHLRRALSLLETQPETVDRRRAELAILSQLGAALMSVHGWSAPEVGEVVEQAAEVGRRLESSTDIAPAIANLWLFNAARARFDRCGEISADLFRIARELDDPAVMLQAHHCAWPIKFNLGLLAESKAHSEAGGAIYDETAHARHRHIYLGHDPGVCSFHFQALAQSLLGFPECGARLAIEGVNLARRLQHPSSLAFSLWFGSHSSILRGDVAAVNTMAQELMGLTDMHELPQPRASGMLFLGWALSRAGETGEGIAWQEKGLAVMAKMGMQVWRTFFLCLLAESLLAAGRYSDGLHQVDQAIEISERGGEQCYLSRLYRLRAELQLKAHGQGDEAVEQNLQQAIAVAQRQGAKGWEIGAATKLARLWGEQGRRAEAQDLLWPIYSWFTEGLDTPDLTEAKTVLDELR